ncbi:MAG TPA: hypothetical protein VN875_03725 [Candidatus Binatus sp.]|jgi:hypothetical protein|nr:hypothetical protein [Candidatus Binatus sp.]
MKKLCSFLLGASFVLAAAGIAVAQDKPGVMRVPPPVLTITREFVKPGKSGVVHERTESAFVKAMTAGKSNQHYLALNSMSGKPRALFLTGYESFEDWEKQNLADMKNATLSAELDRASMADGELLDAMDLSAWVYREDQSLNQTGNLVGIRYMDFEVFQIKPGHEEEWNEAVKIVKDAYAKMPDAHWAMYQNVFGREAPAFLVITPRKSASEIDRDFANGKQFVDAMGPDGLKKLNELTASAIASSERNLFMISPKMSYMGEDLAKADPDFWGHKPE